MSKTRCLISPVGRVVAPGYSCPNVTGGRQDSDAFFVSSFFQVANATQAHKGAIRCSESLKALSACSIL